MAKYSLEQYQKAASKVLDRFKDEDEIRGYRFVGDSTEIMVRSHSGKSHWGAHLEFDGDDKFSYWGPYTSPIISSIAKAILKELQ